MKVTPQLIKAFLIFPFNVMIVIPGSILWGSSKIAFLAPYHFGFDPVRGTLGGLFITVGVVVAYSCVSLFTDHGNGTPSPWNPPKRFVVLGAYRHVRNPMMEGVFCVLLGESLLSGSILIFLWFSFFVVANLLYIPLIEEPQLLSRFGEPYRLYLQNVSRWIPRKTPWKGQSQETPTTSE
jgi:protein-S-isoprenylcysteine O-methyltransferase Ste14